MRVYKTIFGYYEKNRPANDNELVSEHEVLEDIIPFLLDDKDFENGVFVGRHYYQRTEDNSKSRRAQYIDAYRKYQAAVNYGEFERASIVDDYINRLRNKDWSAFHNIPPQIKYFTGEIGLAESGLIRRM